MEAAPRGKRDGARCEMQAGERDGGRRADASERASERTPAVDMLRCHCVVPAPVGCCCCPDCNIVLYCLLPRCSAPVGRLRAADSLSK